MSTVRDDQLMEELRRELADAREQQAATAEILKGISSSPTGFQRVFTVVAASAARLCDAYDVVIRQVDGDSLVLVAHHGRIPPTGTLPLMRGVLTARAALDRRTIQVADLQAETDEYPVVSDVARRVGYRTILAVPLIRAGAAIGVITLRRIEARLFSDKQIALLETFANQAVIAIENTRLFDEVRESLQQQTATADVLKVISRSTFDLQPVLEALIKDATKLCAAEQGFIFRLDGELYHLAADYNAPAGFREWTHRRGIRPGEGTVVGRVALEDRTIQIPDAQADAAWRTTNAQAPGTSGVRTLLGVPMRREGVIIGVIAMWRTEIRPFTDKQVALVETFADQAVIAVENTRLLTELRESLQQQTATADVLKVISRSALDVQKVLDALVESAARLCDARDAAIFQVFGDGLHLVAHYGQIPMSAPVGKLTLPLVRGLVTGRAVIDRQTIQVADMQAEADEYPEARRLARQTGFHTALAVPLVHAGEAIGVIFIRRTEVRPFTERQIELVNTFADQAVIAIENTRLFEEVQARTRDATEALEYQTATSDVLEAISRSPTDAQPVFETIAQSAARLCNAHFCNVFRFDGHLIHFAASYGASAEFRDEKRTRSPVVPSRGFAAARAILDNAVTEIADICADADFDHWRIASVADYRSVLAVPMRKDGLPIGAIAVVRSQIGAFPKRQIELLKTFADQAVIAIENTRLFEAEQASKRELQESL